MNVNYQSRGKSREKRRERAGERKREIEREERKNKQTENKPRPSIGGLISRGGVVDALCGQLIPGKDRPVDVLVRLSIERVVTIVT